MHSEQAGLEDSGASLQLVYTLIYLQWLSTSKPLGQRWMYTWAASRTMEPVGMC